jgi:hypothetical protein
MSILSDRMRVRGPFIVSGSVLSLVGLIMTGYSTNAQVRRRSDLDAARELTLYTGPLRRMLPCPDGLHLGHPAHPHLGFEQRPHY